MEDNFWKVFWIVVLVVFLIGIFWLVSPLGRGVINSHFYAVQKVDDATSYQTKKQVEDTCRSMVASYNSDRLVYEQYKDSDIAEQVSWAEQAKMRANKTAASYNEFILKNSFVWAGNIPSDIHTELEFIEGE